MKTPAESLLSSDLVLTSAIQLVANRIVNKFNPVKIILFGSYAYGEPTPQSDVDLLVIMPVQGDGYMQTAEIIMEAQPVYLFPMDVLVKSPERAEQGYREFDPVLRAAIGKGKVLYERHD